MKEEQCTELSLYVEYGAVDIKCVRLGKQVFINVLRTWRLKTNCVSETNHQKLTQQSHNTTSSVGRSGSKIDCR